MLPKEACLILQKNQQPLLHCSEFVFMLCIHRASQDMRWQLAIGQHGLFCLCICAVPDYSVVAQG